MKRTLSALLSTFFLVQAVSPAWALRPMGSGSASGLRKEIVSSLTGLEEDGQPSPVLLQSITQLARTLTGNYDLTLVPWQPIGNGDWPQWRVMGATNRLQYVPADFQRFPGDGVVGLPLEAIAIASTFDPRQVEPEYQTDGLFWALLTVFVIPRARALMTQKFSGTAADFGRLDAASYFQHKILEVDQAEEDGSVSAFLQFLEIALYEGRRSTEHPDTSLPVVGQAFKETREIRRNLSTPDSGVFYQAVRDQLWPVAGTLLKYDMRQELFSAFQQEPEFRAGLGLSRRQKLLAWQGRLGLYQLNERQTKQAESQMETRGAALSQVEQEEFRSRLLRRLKRGFERLSEQISTGLLPPLAVEEEEGRIDLLEMQQRLFRQARMAVDLARQVAFGFSRLAEPQTGLEERFSPGLVRQLHQEMIGLAEQAQQAGTVVRSLADQIRTLDLDDVEAASRILQLTEQLAAADQEIREQADHLVVDADQLNQRAQSGVFSAAEIQELAAQARQLLERASDLQNRLERLRDQADEAEMTTIELMTEGQMLQRENRSSGPVHQAIRSIARWADPGFQRRRATMEAFSQTLLRALRRIRRLQEENAGSAEQVQQVFQEEMGRLRERAQRLMDRMGVPQQLQEEWQERAMEMTVSDLAEALSRIKMPAQEAPQPYQVSGTDLLKVVPPAAPKSGVLNEPVPPPADLAEPVVAPRRDAAADWKRNEALAWDTHRQLQQWRRGIVGTQADLYRKYRNLRQGIISTARTHLFQWARAASRRRVQTDLADGELDPDALALAKTGTPRLFLEEGKRATGAKGRLSLLVDVSGSMLDPGDISEQDLKALSYHEQARIKTEALRNGTRRIDYVNDLLVTLGEAAGRQSALELQVTIFSNWRPNASVVVKRFDEPWREAKAAEVIDRVLNSHHSGTDDVRAVGEEILRIREGADSKGIKMIWVLSDGFSTDGGAAAMQELVRKNGDVRVFGWGLGPAMRAVKTTYGRYGIAVARMTDLDRQGMAVLNRELRRPVREWVKQEQAASAGLEETTPKPRLAEDGWPVDFPRLHPIQDRAGAGPLQFRRDADQVWFEVDGLRIDPPAQPRVTLSDWAVQELQQMWDVYRLHPRGRNNNLLLYGQAGIGKSLYLRYLWEIVRGWYRAQAERLGSDREELKSRILEFADGMQTRVITFHENIRKSDLSERMHLGEQQAEEAGWTASDLVEGGVAGDQVVLSEVNRAPDEILSELDEPLADRRKTGFEGVRRFHPAARFAAAVNPAEGEVDYQIGYKGRPLSGQFLGHFSKIVMDYPRKTLPDGSDNPEWELFRQHERQVLQDVRRRKIGGEWAVSDSTLDRLLLLANLVREDAWAAQAPFIVTTRALVRMVEQLDRFPHLERRIPDLFFRVYWADDAVHGEGTRAHLTALIGRVFQPAHWPPYRAWPEPRGPAALPRVVSEEVNGVRRELLTYPHWEPDVRIPLAPGTGAHIPEEVFLETDENLHRLEDLLMDVALERNLMNMGDSDTGQSYFIRVLARTLRRNLIVVRLSQDFKLRDVLVSRWYSAGRTGWRDSLPLTYQRAELVTQEGPPIVLWDRGEKGDPGTLAGLNDLLQERRIRLASGEDFVLPEGTIIAVNRTPPRPPYDFFDHSAEFWDRFQHHGYAFPSAPQEMEIVRAHHPALPEGSVRQIVEGMNVLRRLYGGGEIFEPPGVVTTLAAAARLAQKSGPLPLPDLLLEAYSPLRSEERPGIRVALDQEGLGGEVHPTVDPSLGGMMQAHPNLRWSPEVQGDPALWRQAEAVSPRIVQKVKDLGQPVQVGWGLQLRWAADGNPEVAALSTGTDRPFELYAHLAESLRQKVRERSGARFRINGNGIFFSQGPNEEDWVQESFKDSHWKGLRDFLQARGITGRKFVTFQLPPEDDAAWQDLGWLLDPVTLRRNLPSAGRFQGISDSIPLSVEEGRPLSRLAGYSVGFGMVDPADPARRLPPGFLIRAADARAGLEEPELPLRRLPLLPLIGEIPVLAAFVKHGDDEISLRMLDQFERRLDAFLKENPQVKDLIFVEEMGGPVMAEFFRQEGVDVGRLLEADRTDPDGRDLVVRPAFDQMARFVQEQVSGWWSQLHGGQMPKDIQGAWHQRLFELLHQRQRMGYRLHGVVEQPLFEPWWNFILYEDQMEGITPEDLSRPESHAYAEARRKMVEAIGLEREQISRKRDEFIVRRQLVPLLWDVFAEPDPNDLQDSPLEPEQVAVVMVRGRFHAARVESLLRNHFARVEPVLGEELVPESELAVIERYEEALERGGYRAGEAPPEIEKILDQDIALHVERRLAADAVSSAGLEEMRVVAVEDLARQGPRALRLADQVARRQRTGVAHFPVKLAQSASAAFDPKKIELWIPAPEQTRVFNYLIPPSFLLAPGNAVRYVPPDAAQASRQLQEAAQRAEAEGKTVVAVLYQDLYQEQVGRDLVVPGIVTLVVDPDTLDHADRTVVVAAYLSQMDRLRGIILDLTSGTAIPIETLDDGQKHYILDLWA